MIIYLATDFTPYEGEEVIGAYSTFEAAKHAALSGKSDTWHIARAYKLELDTGKKDIFWQEEKEL